MRSRNLVAEANAKDFLVHRVQSVNEFQKFKNPRIVSMGVVTASGDDKPIVEREVVVGRKLSLHHLVQVPPLSLLRQHSPEHPVTTSVHLQQVLRILTAHQHRIPLLSDLTHLRETHTETIWCCSRWLPLRDITNFPTLASFLKAHLFTFITKLSFPLYLSFFIGMTTWVFHL